MAVAGFEKAGRKMVERVRALSPGARMKLGACVAGVVVLGGGLLLRGVVKAPGAAQAAEAPKVVEAPRPPPAARKSYAAGKADERRGEYRAAAQAYAVAARKGDPRGLTKLVAMTHAERCEARSEAALALGTLRDQKATATLKRLARRDYEGEPHGFFSSCSTKAAAQRALDSQHRG